MSVYQRIEELKQEVEKLTGFRPHLEMSFHAHYFPEATDEDFRAARDKLVEDSGGELEAKDTSFDSVNLGKYTGYSAEFYPGKEKTQITFFGPKKPLVKSKS